jgi:3-dehydroquinate dehydratase-2
MRAIAIPVIEVHLSNVHARETYRRRLVTAEGAVGVISGFGVDSYRLALMSIADRLGMKTL